jgi:hypothetical protein
MFLKKSTQKNRFLADFSRFSLVILGLTALSISVLATTVRKIAASQAMGERGAIPTIEVWAGAGVNLDFVQTGGVIQRVWLDDPSRITVDFDAPLCSSDTQCTSASGAKMIHLRRINPINFPQLLMTDSTLLTVITQQGQARKRYQFQITYGRGSPRYSGVTIIPDHQLHGAATNLNKNDILLGLEVAKERGLISSEQGNESLSVRVKKFLSFSQQGVSTPEAAARARVSVALIEKLADLGSSSRPQPFHPFSVQKFSQ